MARLKASLLPAAAIALVFGLSPPDSKLTGEPFPFPQDWTLLAADETSEKRGPEKSASAVIERTKANFDVEMTIQEGGD